MPLIRNGSVVADPWTTVADDEPLPSGPIVVSLDRWRRDRQTLIGRNSGLGVRLASDEPAQAIADDLPRLDLVALEFPTFRDGRAYSTARLLRERYGFAGEVRAVGNVLRDQFLFMHRCGFDAFEVEAATAAAWTAALAEISIVYQAASDDRVPASRRRGLRWAAE
jgi:uncharacterized protein (DUF934 family)